MRALLTALAGTMLTAPGFAATFAIDGTHGKTVQLGYFDPTIEFTAELVSGPASTFNVDFSGWVIPDPRYCSGFPDDPPECIGLQPIFYGDSFDASWDFPEPKEFDIPFFCCGVRGTLTFSATSGGRIVINAPGSAAALPEPATWTTLLGGFGLIGGTLRTRRKTKVLFA